MPNRSRGAELAALTAIAAQVNCTQELYEILASALETTLDVVSADAGEIYLIDEESGDLTLHTHRGLSPSFVTSEACIPPAECLCGLTFTTGEPILASSIQTHPGRSRTACLREGFRSLLSLPLLARGHELGLLVVQSRSAAHFAPGDRELMLAIANQIGIAIANAQLIDDAEQRRATLDSVMQSLVDGFIMVDTRGRIEYMNPRAEQLLDLPASLMLRQPLASIDAHLGSQLIDQGVGSEPFETAALSLPHRPSFELSLGEPTPRIIHVRAFPIFEASADNRRWGLLLRDISREKELEEMKSQLLSTVSHELRTPLASIKGFATTLLREDVEWDEATRRDFLRIIDNESDRLTELISNLLDMSRIEAGTLRVEPEPTDLRPIIEETLAEFEVMTREHSFQARAAESLPLVMVDPRRARQVLRNLVENAVKYSPQGGQVFISVATVADRVRVSVSDQGIGIEPEHLVRLFDRFYQVDSASTRQVGGSGLGLSIAKAIIEAHNGEIWVESQPGMGSVFSFTIPQAKTTSAVMEA